MNGGHFAALVTAETRKLFSRTSARIGLLLAAVIGVGVPLLRGIWRIIENRMAIAADLDPAAVLDPIDPTDWMFWALAVRNFWIFRVILIVVGALVFAGEYQSRTLREDMLRPVPRWAVLISKWLALDIWVAATIAITFGSSALLGVIAWGPTGAAWGDVALGYLSTLATDAGFAALVLCVAVATRSVPGTIAGVVVFYFFEFSVWVGLWVLQVAPIQGIPEMAKTGAESAVRWLPSAAFGVWTGAYSSVAWSWQGFTSLAILTALSLLIAERLLSRLDVP